VRRGQKPRHPVALDVDGACVTFVAVSRRPAVLVRNDQIHLSLELEDASLEGTQLCREHRCGIGLWFAGSGGQSGDSIAKGGAPSWRTRHASPHDSPLLRSEPDRTTVGC